MIMTQEQAILKGEVQLEEMAELVRRASRDGRAIDQVERELWQSVLALGHTLLAGYVAGGSGRDAGL